MHWKNKYLYGLILSSIVVLSYLNYSEQCYPLLTSDGALNILMTYDYQLPQDLYCWGQDRGGTIIPLLAQPLYKVLGLSPIIAVSIAHYLLLILGFFALAYFFKQRSSKLLLALLWFLPPWHYVGFVLYPFSTQYSIIAIGMVFAHKAYTTPQFIQKNLHTSMACCFFLLAVWASDMSIVTIALLPIVGAAYIWWQHKGAAFKRIKIAPILVILAWTAAGTWFLYHAKLNATKTVLYNESPINDIATIIASIKIVLRSIIDVLLFRAPDVVESIYAWMVLIGIPAIFLFARKKPTTAQPTSLFWQYFFLINAMALMGALICSHWVYLNGVGKRYFSTVYISAALAFLLYLDRKVLTQMRWSRPLLGLSLFVGGLSGFHQFYYPQFKPSTYSVVSEFKSLGKIGVFAHYWNAYISAVADPENIKATPHDGDLGKVRKPELLKEALAQPRIFVVRDMWMESFPPSIMQFGHRLEKVGDEQFLGGAYICEYKLTNMKALVTHEDGYYQGTLIADSASTTGSAVLIKEDFNPDQHFLWGPFLKLNPGTYKVRYRLKLNGQHLTNNYPVATIEISAGHGKEMLLKRDILPSDFIQPNDYNTIEVTIAPEQAIEGVELRILYYGSAPMYFDNIVLEEVKE